jgi:hypothetical protein
MTGCCSSDGAGRQGVVFASGTRPGSDTRRAKTPTLHSKKTDFSEIATDAY